VSSINSSKLLTQHLFQGADESPDRESWRRGAH